MVPSRAICLRLVGSGTTGRGNLPGQTLVSGTLKHNDGLQMTLTFEPVLHKCHKICLETVPFAMLPN